MEHNLAEMDMGCLFLGTLLLPPFPWCMLSACIFFMVDVMAIYGERVRVRVRRMCRTK